MDFDKENITKISVIIPVYNVAGYLEKCLESIAKQTLEDIEVICVNDGSKDNSLAILEQYAKKDARFKVINQVNSGAGASRNVGIEHANGEYLAFVDADDWLAVDFLEKVYQKAKLIDADVVETLKSYNVYEKDRVKLFRKRKACGFKFGEAYFRRDVVWDKLYKTSFVKEHQISFPNGLCHNDAFFLLQCLYFGARIVNENEAVYWHNKANEMSIRFKPSDKKLLSQLDMFILEIEFLNSHFFSFYDYRHNYNKLFKTAKRKRKYVKECKNKKIYDEKVAYIKRLNKYPWSAWQIMLKKLFCARFREELMFSKAKSVDYPKLLKKWYKKKLGRTLDLENPKTFNEKINWLKLYDSTPTKTRLADKYAVRDFVKEKIGEEYLVPLLGVYSSFDEIDFEKLPERFVLKCNHGSAMNAVIKNKKDMNAQKLKHKFDNWMRENFGFTKGLQLHYNRISHKIIAEEFIEPIDDYKFFCYDGKCKHVLHKYEEGGKTHFCNFDVNFNCWKLSPVSEDREIAVPPHFEKMMTLAEVLSKGFSFVRVDLLLSGDDVYFSEMTFTPHNGVNIYYENWDEKLGKFLGLNVQSKLEGF